MKKLLLFGVIALFLSVMGGCEKEQKKTVKRKEKLEIKNFSHTDCKKSAYYIEKSNQRSREEYLELKADRKYLRVRHIDALLNCCPEEIIATSKISNDTLYIREKEKSPHGCDCACLYDLDYKIGKLDYTKYYVVLTMRRSKEPYLEFELDFNENYNNTIYIKKHK